MNLEKNEMIQTLPDCLLLKIVKHIGINHSLTLKNTNRELYDRMKPLIHEDAARRIKHFWKWCRFFSSNDIIAKSFDRTNLSAPGVMSFRLEKIHVTYFQIHTNHEKTLHSFPGLKSHLVDGLVLYRTKRFFRRINLLCATSTNPSPIFAINELHTAYLVKYHRQVAFRDAGELEQVLLGSSCCLLSCVDSMLTHLVAIGPFSSMPKYLVKSFPILLTQYLNAFQAWHAADKATTAARVRTLLVTLYRAEREIPEFDAEDSRLRIAFRVQVAQLRAIFVRVAGEDSLNRFDAEIVDELNGVVDGLLNVLEVAQNGDGSV